MKNSEEKAGKYKPSTSKRAVYLSIVIITLLTWQLYLSFVGMSNSWSCNVDALDAKYELICYRLIQNTSCRNIYGPLALDAVIDIQTRFKGYLSIQCPWNIASTELRIFFSALSLAFIIYLLYIHIRKKPINIPHAKVFSIILSILIGTTSIFDLLSIINSHKYNSSLCSGSNLPYLGSGISILSIQCPATNFFMTPLISALTSISMMLISYSLLHPDSKIETD